MVQTSLVAGGTLKIRDHVVGRTIHPVLFRGGVLLNGWLPQRGPKVGSWHSASKFQQLALQAVQLGGGQSRQQPGRFGGRTIPRERRHPAGLQPFVSILELFGFGFGVFGGRLQLASFLGRAFDLLLSHVDLALQGGKLLLRRLGRSRIRFINAAS